MTKKKPVLLCILDGWGIGNDSDLSNAIARASTPNYDRFLKKYPNSKIETSGPHVGLPAGQIGNSEVGHMTIGAGRVIFQDLPRINNAINEDRIDQKIQITNLIKKLKESGKDCHLVGLLSDGGVHCHIDHIIAIARILLKNHIKVILHIFLDGRDVEQRSALKYIERIDGLRKEYDSFQVFDKAKERIKVATISGRYYAMDRDNNWDRIKLATDAIISAKANKFDNGVTLIQKAYDSGITDEFIKPAVIDDYTGVKDGDGLVICNFRADRIRQIAKAFLDSGKFDQRLSMVEYSKDLNDHYQAIFPPIEVNNSLGEVLSKQKLSQLRIAETEKYAHVTFFFSCGLEQEFEGESRILIKSPQVATYDLKPEMSAVEVGEELVKAINSDQFDFIVVNYANADMVGHSGNIIPAIKACEVIDKQLGNLEEAILKQGGVMLITADHGNIEMMIDNKDNPHTSHTLNPVPLIIIGDNKISKLSSGCLSDVAPTILGILGIDIPEEMTGKNLIRN